MSAPVCPPAPAVSKIRPSTPASMAPLRTTKRGNVAPHLNAGGVQCGQDLRRTPHAGDDDVRPAAQNNFEVRVQTCVAGAYDQVGRGWGLLDVSPAVLLDIPVDLVEPGLQAFSGACIGGRERPPMAPAAHTCATS